MILRRIFLYFKQFDWILFITAFLLVCFGLAVIYSIAFIKENPDFLNFKKQIFSFVIGIIFLFLFSLIDYKLLKSYYIFLYILASVLLISVLIFGRTIHGTTGWFSYGIFNFQPVEFIKLILIIFLAKYFSDRARELGRLQYIILSGIFTAVLIFLVLLQPDFGSALILFILWFGLLLVIGMKRSHLLLILGLIAIMIIGSWLFALAPYQKDRVSTFLNPSSDPLGRGYSMTQSVVAVGSGKIFGRGLGFGSQSQLRFLPESQTDFIFAVIAEELGFAGVIFILGFFIILFYRISRNAREIGDDFGLFFTLGSLILLFTQAFVNIGMNIGVAPITGITLPFISYGGSSLITNMIILGILESIFIRNKRSEI
jgi:rod shape determining protein RodA